MNAEFTAAGIFISFAHELNICLLELFFSKKNKIKIKKKKKLKNNFKKIINNIQCFLREIPKWGIPNERVIIPPGNRYVQMIYSAAYILSNTWLRGDVTYHVDFSQVKRVKY